MGSWNETCALSNLPISYQEEIVYLFIQPRYPHIPPGRGCYPNDFFGVRSLPFYSRYNDYGEIEYPKDEREEFFCNLMINQFQEDLVPQKAKDLRADWGDLTFETLDLSTLQSWVHEEELKVLQPNFRTSKEDEVHPVPILILKRVWDKYLGMKLKDWSGVTSLDLMMQISDEVVENASSANPSEKELSYFSLLYRLELSFDEDRKYNPLKKYFNGYGGISSKHIHKILTYFFKKVVKGKEYPETLRKILYRACELFMVMEVMYTTRQAWFPTTGVGSQSEFLPDHFRKNLAFVEAALDLIEDTLQEYEPTEERSNKTIKIRSLMEELKENVKDFNF